MNGCAPGLALMERLRWTRKWAINKKMHRLNEPLNTRINIRRSCAFFVSALPVKTLFGWRRHWFWLVLDYVIGSFWPSNYRRLSLGFDENFPFKFPEISSVEWSSIFLKFPEKGATLRGNFCFIWLSSWKFRTFWLNVPLSGNSTISGFSGNISRKVLLFVYVSKLEATVRHDHYSKSFFGSKMFESNKATKKYTVVQTKYYFKITIEEN